MIPILLTDANTPSAFIYNFVIEFTGGDWILLGIVVLMVLIFVLAMARVRSGGIVAVGAAFFFVLSLFNPIFMFLFWIALIIAIFVLVNAIRKKITGQ